MIDEACKNCVFLDEEDEELPCSMSSTVVKCSILKDYVEFLKFKKEVKL